MDEFARERRIFTPIDEIPDRIRQAFISAEDKNFYAHHGFDPRGIVAALYDAATTGERLRGASTITQQVMKNFLLTGDRSGERKIKEIILATRLENTLSKDEILELYLNEIFLGQNSYGVTAAAQIYFAKSLEELTLAETAYLAALPQAPSVLHPVREKPRAIARRNYVLDQMAENGYVTRDEAEAAKAEDLLTVQCGAIASARSEMPPRDYFTDEIRRQLSAKLGDERALHRRPADPRHRRPRPADGGGARRCATGSSSTTAALSVYRGPVAQIDPASFDPADEASWRAALCATQVPRDIDGWHPAVILSIGETSARIGIEGVPEDADGHFLAFADASWARLRGDERGRLRAAEGPDDMWDVGDVVLVEAVESDGASTAGPTARSRRSRAASWRWTPRPAACSPCRAASPTSRASSTAPPRRCASPAPRSSPSSTPRRSTAATRPATIVLDAPIEVATGAGIWTPENAGDNYYGPTPIRTGLEQSRNLMTVRIAQDVGMDTVAEVRRALRHLRRHAAAPQLLARRRRDDALQDGRRLREFANGGLKVEPTLVDRVQDRYGKTIYRHDQRACEGCAADDIAAAQPAAGALQRRADHGRDHRLPDHLDAAGRGRPRHQRQLGRPARPQPRRQDRHHQRGQGRLVHRLLPAHRRRLLHGLRHARARSAKAPSAARSARRSSSSSSRRRWRGRGR